MSLARTGWIWISTAVLAVAAGVAWIVVPATPSAVILSGLVLALGVHEGLGALVRGWAAHDPRRFFVGIGVAVLGRIAVSALLVGVWIVARGPERVSFAVAYGATYVFACVVEALGSRARHGLREDAARRTLGC